MPPGFSFFHLAQYIKKYHVLPDAQEDSYHKGDDIGKYLNILNRAFKITGGCAWLMNINSLRNIILFYFSFIYFLHYAEDSCDCM